MLGLSRKLRLSVSKLASVVVILGGLLFGRSTETKRSPSIPERIAAVQNALHVMPFDLQEVFLFEAQWGNWGNWNNWNNWGNWGNWANWNNWGNWGNY
jgi:hypothetical protein